MSLFINEQNKHKIANKPTDDIGKLIIYRLCTFNYTLEQGMLFENSKDRKEMFNKRTKKLYHHKRKENPDGDQRSSSPLNKDIEIYQSSVKSSQDIK